MRTRSVKHKNITRVDHAASHKFGYSVRVMWQGEQRSRFFADAKYGDRLGALAAALEWRNATEQELGKPRTERQVLGIVYSSSGIPGVRRLWRGDHEYYEATWGTTVGKQGRARYSISRYGEKRARQLAIQARARGEQARLRTPAHPDD